MGHVYRAEQAMISFEHFRRVHFRRLSCQSLILNNWCRLPEPRAVKAWYPLCDSALGPWTLWLLWVVCQHRVWGCGIDPGSWGSAAPTKQCNKVGLVILCGSPCIHPRLKCSASFSSAANYDWLIQFIKKFGIGSSFAPARWTYSTTPCTWGPRWTSTDFHSLGNLDVEIDFHGDLDGPRPWSPKA